MYREPKNFFPHSSHPAKDQPIMATLTVNSTRDLIGWVLPTDLSSSMIRIYHSQTLEKQTPLSSHSTFDEHYGKQRKPALLNDWLTPEFIHSAIGPHCFSDYAMNTCEILAIQFWPYSLARFYCQQIQAVKGSNEEKIRLALRLIKNNDWLIEPLADWLTVPAEDLFNHFEIKDLVKELKTLTLTQKEKLVVKKTDHYSGEYPSWVSDRILEAGYMGHDVDLLIDPPLSAHHEPRYSVAHSLEWRYYRAMIPCGAFAKDFLPPKDEPRLFGELMAPTHGEILATKSKAAPYRILWAILTYQGTPKQVRFYTPPKGGAYGEYTQCELIYVTHGRVCTLSAFVHHDRVKQAQEESEKWLSLSPIERLQNQGSFLYWVLANPTAPGHTEALEKHPNPLVV